MSLYSDIIFQAAHTASIIPLATEPTFFSMYAFAKIGFGDHNMVIAAVAAVFGASLGAGFNFILGILLRKKYLSIEGTKFLSLAQYAKGKVVFSRIGFLFLLASWMPLLNFTVFAAGFFGMHKKIAIPLVITGLIAHYGYYAFN